MCGIIGYLGDRAAAPIIMESLKRLEYRGYDSAGVAIYNEDADRTSVVKSAAKVDTLVDRLTEEMPAGHLGIGHTRWATHGRPTVINAHPHTDCTSKFMVIHNGIIENFAELRRDLIAKGHVFVSETDTEVVPHLIEEHFKGDLVAAVREALGKLRGAYAMAIFSQHDPDLLIGARLNAPLVVGVGEKEWFIASDITAIIPYTKKVLLLGEGEMVAISSLGPEVGTLSGSAVKPRIIEVKWDISQAQKGGYPHFMAKEINEAPQAISNALRGRLTDEGEVTFEEFGLTDRQLLKFRDIKMVAAGTSFYAALVGKYIIEELARIPVEVEPASEFRYRQPIIDQDTLVIGISQSGETADTLAAIREAHRLKAKVVSVTNVVGSSMALESDGVIYLHAGPEIGVASTKTFIAHIVCLYLLGIRLAAVRHRIPAERLRALAAELKRLPEAVDTVLERADTLQAMARKYAGYRNFMYIGRGINYPIALEGALKLKEISYLHAEGYAAGELKHGPIALLDRSFPVFAIATTGATTEKVVSNVQEVLARDAPVIALVTDGDPVLDEIAADRVAVPAVSEFLSPVPNVVAMQLFAYFVATERGCNVDQPRNLAKSVTVE
ncbi:MAG TPA: glutamine--fructose-6-phosphate transaminase (isomerizing) [Candidatus Limnocylindrales bacterium]|nr:glutamine--fructose-6-phosphate transaminase (isomerizing) [Candidatus Limnocylindrales bacterium]